MPDWLTTESPVRDADGKQVSTAGEWMAGDGIAQVALRYVHERRLRGELTGTSPISYREILALFAGFVGPEKPPGKVTKRQVERFLEKGAVSPGTIRNRLTVLRGFFAYCVERKLARTNPTSGIRPPRRPRAVPRALKPKDVAAVLRHTPDARGRVMVCLMCQEGLRSQEVAGLDRGDVDLDRRLLLVRHGKAGHERVLPISDETMDALRSYLAESPAGEEPLIRSERNPHSAISPQYVALLVSSWLHDAGVKQTAHALRHTAATDMLQNGAELLSVQHALGHSSLRSTERYLAWSQSVTKLREAMGGRRYGPTAAGLLWAISAVAGCHLVVNGLGFHLGSLAT